MSRQGLGLLAVVLVLLAAGCPNNEPQLATPKEEVQSAPSQPEGLLSSVNVADPRAEAQLLEGFYGLEQGSWRWTARKFSLALQPPSGAEGQESELELNFTLPDAVVSRLKTVTLSARIEGVDLGSETYEKAGDYTFAKTVPADALAGGDAVKVEFELDQALPAGEADQRELGIVVTSVALQ